MWPDKEHSQTYRRDPVGRVSPGRNPRLLVHRRARGSAGPASGRPGRSLATGRRSARTFNHANRRTLAGTTAFAELRHEVGVLGIKNAAGAGRAARTATHRPAAARGSAIARHVSLRATVVASDVGRVVALLGAVPFLQKDRATD